MRQKIPTILSLLLCIILFAAAGAKEANEKPLSPEDFIELYVDLSIVAEQFLDDSVSLAHAQDSIFIAHGTTRVKFDEFRTKMDIEPEKWAEIWESIVKRLEERDREAQKKTRQKAQDKKDE